MALVSNTTVNERPEARRLRATIQEGQDQKRARNEAIANAHRNESGPGFSAGTVSQDMPQKPVIRRPGAP